MEEPRHAAARRGGFFLLITAVVFLILFFTVVFLTPTSEWASRYLLLLYPVFSILALFVLQFPEKGFSKNWSTKIVLFLFVPLAAMSVANQGYGLRRLAMEKNNVLNAQVMSLRENPVRAVVTDYQFFPEVTGTLYFERDFYFIPRNAREKDWQQLLGSLYANGTRRFLFVSRHGEAQLPIRNEVGGIRIFLEQVLKAGKPSRPTVFFTFAMKKGD